MSGEFNKSFEIPMWKARECNAAEPTVMVQSDFFASDIVFQFYARFCRNNSFLLFIIIQ